MNFLAAGTGPYTLVSGSSSVLIPLASVTALKADTPDNTLAAISGSQNIYAAG